MSLPVVDAFWLKRSRFYNFIGRMRSSAVPAPDETQLPAAGNGVGDQAVRSNRDWEKVVDSMEERMAIIDRDFRILRVNKAMARHLRLPIRKVIGLTCYKYLHTAGEPPQFCPLLAHNRKDAGRRGPRDAGEDVAGNPVSVAPVYGPAHGIAGCVYIARQRDRGKSGAPQREEIVRFLLRKAHYIVFMQNPGGKCIFFDAVPREGPGPEYFIGKRLSDIFEPAMASELSEMVRKTVKDRRETRQYVTMGSEFFMRQITPVRTVRNKVIGVVTVLQKVTLPLSRGDTEFPLRELTGREREILYLIASGHTSRQIAEKLFISKATVLTHRRRIMKKCNFHKVTDLVRFAIESGLKPSAVHPDDPQR